MGVEGMSIVLSRRWGIDPERCLLAALLHDLAKPLPEKVQRERLEHVDVFPVSKADCDFPKVWHGMLAAQEARDVYGVQDDEVLEAVAFHSTGRRNLRETGLVIYVADFTEPSRSWEGVEQARAELAEMNLYSAARRVAHLKLEKIRKQNKPPHPLTREMSDWLDSKMEKEN